MAHSLAVVLPLLAPPPPFAVLLEGALRYDNSTLLSLLSSPRRQSSGRGDTRLARTSRLGKWLPDFWLDDLVLESEDGSWSSMAAAGRTSIELIELMRGI